MTNHYLLSISDDKTDACFKLTYTNGRFKKLEGKRQKMPEDKRAVLMKLVPLKESDLKEIAYSNVTIDKLENNASLYTQMLAEYSEFYIGRYEIAHNMNSIEGKALKSIITALKKQCSTDDETFALWKQILRSWNSLEPFYQKQTELRQINSNLNIILKELKNVSKTNTGTYAGDFRSSI